MKAHLQPDGSLRLEGASEDRIITPHHPRYQQLMECYQRSSAIALSAARLAARLAARDEETDPPAEYKVPPGYGGHPWIGGSPEFDCNYQVPIEHLHTDPDRFRFPKNDDGPDFPVGDDFDAKLCSVLAVWRDWHDGKTYILDGHRRFELAEAAGVESLPCRYLNKRNIREAKEAARILNGIAEKPQPAKPAPVSTAKAPYVPNTPPGRWTQDPDVVDVADVPEGWTIRPYGTDGLLGLFRSGRDTPVATARTHGELAERIAGHRPKAPKPEASVDDGWNWIRKQAAEHTAWMQADAVRIEAERAEIVRLSAAGRESVAAEISRLEALNARVVQLSAAERVGREVESARLETETARLEALKDEVRADLKRRHPITLEAR